MTPAECVELVGAACLCATGWSHWRHHGAWSRHFARWSEMGNSGALLNGLLHAGVGALFVLVHPVFTGPSSLLTWWATLVLIKGLTYLVAPSIGLRSMRRVAPDRSRSLRWVGVPMVALGLAVGGIALT